MWESLWFNSIKLWSEFGTLKLKLFYFFIFLKKYYLKEYVGHILMTIHVQSFDHSDC